MPAGLLWNLQYANLNSQRAYPFTEAATRTDISGTFKIPDDFLLELSLPVHAGLDVLPERFLLKTLYSLSTGYSLVIGYDNGTTLVDVASCNIPKAEFTENSQYVLTGQGDFADSIGAVLIGRLDNINQLPPGQFSFDRTGGQLEVECIRPQIQYISSLVVVNGSERSPLLTGDIELVALTNMRITASTPDGQNPRLLFSAISGEGLNEACECDSEAVGPPLRTVNGIAPGLDSDFRVLGDDCIQITPITNGIRVRNRCAEPCCGCEELAALNRQIDRFADGAVTLTSLANTMSTSVTQMSLVVLGSRLQDGGCLDCS